MDTPDGIELPQSLAADLPWIRRLAFALVRDDADADDVAQDAVTRILQRGRGWSAASPVRRGWIARIVQRLAIDRVRSDVARRRREQQRAESVPRTAETVGDVLDRGLRAQQVLDAVMSLDEPYRTTVLMRYLDERTVADVARSTKVGESTVRKRLARALEMLRVRLGVDLDPDARSEMSALAGVPVLAGPVTTPVASGAWFGAVTAAAAVLITTAWLVVQSRDPESTTVALSAPLSLDAEPSATSVDGEEVLQAPDAPSPRFAGAREALELAGRPVRVLAVDTHAPIVDATVRLVREERIVHESRTDATGVVRWPEELTKGARVMIDASNYFPLRVNAGDIATLIAKGDPLSLELDVAASLRVRVKDERGRPVRGAHVEVCRADPVTGQEDWRGVDAWPLWFTKCSNSMPGPLGAVPLLEATNDDGEVLLYPVPRDRDLWVTASGDLPVSKVKVPAAIGSAERNVDVRLTASGTLRGRVINPEGLPLSVELQFWGHGDDFPRRRFSGRDGTFAIDGLPLGTVSWRVDLAGEPMRGVFLDRADKDIGDASTHFIYGRFRAAIRTRAFDGLETECSPISVQIVHAGSVIAVPVVQADRTFQLLLPVGPSTMYVRIAGVDLRPIAIQTPDTIDVNAEDETARVLVTDVPEDMGDQVSLMFQGTLPESWAFAASRGKTLSSNGCNATVRVEGGCVRAFGTPVGSQTVWMCKDLPYSGTPRVLLGTFDFQPGVTTSLRFPDVATGIVRGHVRDVGGDPVVGCELELVSNDDPSVPRVPACRTDSTGAFQFPPCGLGAYQVVPRRMGRDSTCRADAKLDDLHLDVAVNLVVAREATIAVHVVAYGKPVAGELVIVGPDDPLWGRGERWTARTDSSGTCSFSLPAGKYYASIAKDATARTPVSRWLRRLDASNGGIVEATLDSGRRPRRVRIVQVGRTVEDLRLSMAFGKDWQSVLRPVALRPGEVEGYLEPGRTVLVMRAASHEYWNRACDTCRPEESLIATVDVSAEASEDTLIATISDAVLDVVGTDEPLMPDAYVLEVDGISLGRSMEACPRLTHVDSPVGTDGRPAVRRFSGVPAGRVRLGPAPFCTGPVFDVGSASDSTAPIVWPPK